MDAKTARQKTQEAINSPERKEKLDRLLNEYMPKVYSVIERSINAGFYSASADFAGLTTDKNFTHILERQKLTLPVLIKTIVLQLQDNGYVVYVSDDLKLNISWAEESTQVS
jgi:hypothetical protein